MGRLHPYRRGALVIRKGGAPCGSREEAFERVQVEGTMVEAGPYPRRKEKFVKLVGFAAMVPVKQLEIVGGGMV